MIVKDIVTNEVTEESDILLSSFRPLGLKELLDKIPKEHYVIGVGYIEGDYQICISGKRKKNETINKTVYREMLEELSLVPLSEPIIFSKKNKNYFFTINLENTIIRVNNNKYDTGADTSERAIICIHGDRNTILNYISNVNLEENNCDFITHIWADKVKNLIKHF